MKIKTKVLLGFGAVPMVIILLIGVGWYQIKSMNKASDQMQKKYELVMIAGEIQIEIKDAGMEIRNILIPDDQDTLEKEISKLETLTDSITLNISKLEEENVTEEQSRLIKELKDTNQSFVAYKNHMINLVNKGQQKEAIKQLALNSGNLQEQYFQHISELSKSLEVEMLTSIGQASKDFQKQLLWGMVISLSTLILAIGFVMSVIWNAVKRLNKVSNVMIGVSNGTFDLDTRIEIVSNDEIDDVASSFNSMTESLHEQVEKEQRLSKENQEFAWVKSNLAEMMAELTGIEELQPFTRTFLSKVVPLMDASQAAFYINEWDEENSQPSLRLLSSYAFKERQNVSNTFRFGEGLVGQAALENSPIILTNVPADYIRIHSGLGEASPLNIYVLPISIEGDVKAVIELASFNRFSPYQQSLLEELTGNIGIMVDSIISRVQLAKLLQESQVLTEELQAQSEELQSQQEELKAANEEMETQTQTLRDSEERLQAQQEELEEMNEELREKAEILELQNKRLEATNKEVERAKAELEEKAKQLALSSKYKSEFLANMSHELRTPLNSLLILSKLLSDNQSQNLTEKQVEFAKTIYSSGVDLLTLINDILDLAKIESGKMEVNPSAVLIKDVADFAEKNFRQVANEKKLGFTIHLKEDVPTSVYSDAQRLHQLLMNLLSNAFKFTNQGEVKLEIGKSRHPNEQLGVYFAISDTGIGIPDHSKEIVFEAFQQADGTTSRKYGGTGLGLSICRELASLLGGEIVLDSVEGRGSTFTFYLGDYYSTEKEVNRYLSLDEAAVFIDEEIDLASNLQNNSNHLQPKDSQKGSTKPIDNIKRLLIVDDDKKQRNSLMELIGDKEVVLKAVSSGAEALEELKIGSFDCMILDLGLSDTTGFELLEKVKDNPLNKELAIFIYTGRDLTAKEEILLKKHTQTIIIKDSHSPNRLLEELEWFLNSNLDINSLEVEASDVGLLNDKRDLDEKKVLLVDDDVRNVFAISNILEMFGMKVTFAENGIECLQILQDSQSQFDIVLMDIMMPEMDGYETMEEIRKNADYQELPIIALTAKAMIEDRDKCINAGASDYIVKPVNPDQLISLIRVWLFTDAKNS